MRVIGQIPDAPIRFTIEPYFAGGFVLDLGLTHGTARAGRWPTEEKAQEMAQRIAAEVLNGATVAWDRPQ